MKTALLLDFDDTIFDLNSFRVGYNQFWAENFSNETNAKIIESLEKYRKHGNAFEPYQMMTDDEKKCDGDYCRQNAPQFIHTDVADFLDNLDQDKFVPIIMTFGEEEFQKAKINALGLDLPAIFLDHPDKTLEISRLWNGDHYEINGETYSEIILVDDRDRSFNGFEKLPNARGFLLNRGSHADKNDHELLAKNVKVVDSFCDIML
ncbi:hypothetical protein FWG95_02230 [Candidatus Saccharibacteria bacterium]|nr:hypothetical protein [Candidatus Saccharibacteria bacterium]